jgi:hypothetical protein
VLSAPSLHRLGDLLDRLAARLPARLRHHERVISAVDGVERRVPAHLLQRLLEPLQVAKRIARSLDEEARHADRPEVSVAQRVQPLRRMERVAEQQEPYAATGPKRNKPWTRSSSGWSTPA